MVLLLLWLSFKIIGVRNKAKNLPRNLSLNKVNLICKETLYVFHLKICIDTKAWLALLELSIVNLWGKGFKLHKYHMRDF